MRFEDMLTYTSDAVIFGFSPVYLPVQLHPLHKGTIRVFLCVRVCVNNQIRQGAKTWRERQEGQHAVRGQQFSVTTQTNRDEDEVTNRNLIVIVKLNY